MGKRKIDVDEVVDFDSPGRWEEPLKDQEMPPVKEKKLPAAKRTAARKKASKKQAAARKEEGAVLAVWGIPDDIREGFKDACKANGETMRAVLSDLMGSYIIATVSVISAAPIK